MDESADQRNTALHHAAGAGAVDAVRVLLQAGADATRQNAAGQTPLSLAQRAGHERVVALLRNAPPPAK